METETAGLRMEAKTQQTKKFETIKKKREKTFLATGMVTPVENQSDFSNLSIY